MSLIGLSGHRRSSIIRPLSRTAALAGNGCNGEGLRMPAFRDRGPRAKPASENRPCANLRGCELSLWGFQKICLVARVFGECWLPVVMHTISQTHWQTHDAAARGEQIKGIVSTLTAVAMDVSMHRPDGRSSKASPRCRGLGRRVMTPSAWMTSTRLAGRGPEQRRRRSR
jgi:hypothetical protein